MNKNIPTILGIAIIVVLAAIALGFLTWQYYLLLDEITISKFQILEAIQEKFA